MNNQNEYLFTLELRIKKQIVKLNVYEQDSINDLINRLAKTVQYKQKYNERLKEKLQNEFKKLIATEDCSTKVKGKLQSLTEESKLIIIGVSQVQKEDQSLNQTPFKILLQSSANFRKHSVQNTKKQYNYDQNNSSPLIKKYNKQLIPEIIFQNKSTDDKNIGLKYKYPNTTNNYAYQSSENSGKISVLQDKTNLRQYSPIINISSKRSIKSSSNHYDNKVHLDVIAEEQQRIRKQGCIRKFSGFGQYQNQNQYGSYKESFYDYKIQKNKSQTFLSKPIQNLKRNYLSNQQDIPFTRVQNKLVYNQNADGLTKINYSNDQLTKIDYSTKYFQGKAGLQGGIRGNKKFSYLSQSNL